MFWVASGPWRARAALERRPTIEDSLAARGSVSGISGQGVGFEQSVIGFPPCRQIGSMQVQAGAAHLMPRLPACLLDLHHDQMCRDRPISTSIRRDGQRRGIACGIANGQD